MPDSRFLTGYRIIDLSQYIPGPFATRLLADHGAEVIKIEPPHGDPMRHFLKPEGDTPSPLYRHLNRGKKIVRLDLKTDAGKALFTRLLASADVLLESFRPGVMARLGFGRETLQEINPKLIHCALSGFGQTGPYRERGGHDLTYCAVSGALSASGTVERPVMTFPHWPITPVPCRRAMTSLPPCWPESAPAGAPGLISASANLPLLDLSHSPPGQS